MALNLINIYAGNSLAVDITALQANGLPYDLSTVSAIAWTLARAEGAPPLVSKSYPNSGITVNSPASAGVFAVTINSNDTQSLPAGAYFQESAVTDASGNKVTCYVGWVILLSSNI